MNEAQQREAERRDLAAELQRARHRETLLNQLQAGRHVEHDVPLFAHCGNVLTCSDEQIPVIGTKTTTNQTYADNGGDGLMANYIERSWFDLDFQNDEDRVCKACGGTLHLSESLRPIYSPLSGHDQRGLVEIAKKLILKGIQPTTQAIFDSSKPTEPDRVAVLEQQLAELKALVAGNGHSAPSESPVDPPAATLPPKGGVKGYRKRGERFEALIYRSESGDGKQHSIGAFDTPEEAVAAREAALSEEAQ